MTVSRDIASIVTDLEGMATDGDITAVAVVIVRKDGGVREMVHWQLGTRFILLGGLYLTTHVVAKAFASEDDG